jgi:DNA-binding NtrC family response regulator
VHNPIAGAEVILPSVLIVDDDTSMAETLADILIAMHYTVAIADSGETALVSVQKENFDVVLMDIKMDGINGVQALQEMKRSAPSTKVIMMTGYRQDELVEEARKSNAVAIVDKPLDLDHVLGLVKRVAQTSADDRGRGA